jgi:colanic acid/amylovoran biosynthesis protein
MPFASFFAQLLDLVSEKLNCNVLFVAHVTGPARNKDDRVVARSVKAQMKRPAWVLDGDYRPEELKGIIARTQLFFGARMHANIAALSSGVPTVAVSYSHKTQGIMESLKQRDRVVRIGDLNGESCLQKLEAAWRDRNDIVEVLKEEVPRVQRRSRENVDLLLSLLESERSRP